VVRSFEGSNVLCSLQQRRYKCADSTHDSDDDQISLMSRIVKGAGAGAGTRGTWSRIRRRGSPGATSGLNELCLGFCSVVRCAQELDVRVGAVGSRACDEITKIDVCVCVPHYRTMLTRFDAKCESDPLKPMPRIMS
jgi:hypothetical protein